MPNKNSWGEHAPSVHTPPKWCGRKDLNLHEFPHQNLNLARLPIPPRPHAAIRANRAEKILPDARAIFPRYSAAKENFELKGKGGSSPCEADITRKAPVAGALSSDGGPSGTRVFASRIRTPPSQAQSGEFLKTCHWHVFLTEFHLIGSSPCEADITRKAPVAGALSSDGGPSGTRTPDLGIKSPLLYQLS